MNAEMRPLNSNSAQFAMRQLELAIAGAERDASVGRFNIFSIRTIARAAALLGNIAAVDRARTLLRNAPDSAFLERAIRNFEPSKDFVESSRIVEPCEIADMRHPPLSEEALRQNLNRFANEPHIALCLERRFEEAQSEAPTPLQIEEIAETAAVLGEFDFALILARKPMLDPGRKNQILLVTVIELFRRGETLLSEEILRERETAGVGAWDRVSLSLGFAGREPWPCYPYPDY